MDQLAPTPFNMVRVKRKICTYTYTVDDVQGVPENTVGGPGPTPEEAAREIFQAGCTHSSTQ